MEEKTTNENRTTFVEPNKPPFNNKIYKLQVEIMDGYSESLRSGKLYEKYNGLIKDMTMSGKTLQDLNDVEIQYIKKDLEYIAQAYFSNFINYPEYLAGTHNIMTAFNILRGNWQLQHPPQPQGEVVNSEAGTEVGN